MTKDIYAPAQGEPVQIGQNTNSYSISLSDEMLASVRMSRVSLRERFIAHTALAYARFQKFEDNEVGFVTGRITTNASSNIPVLEPTNQASHSASVNRPSSALLLPRVLGARPTQRLPHSTMIGELKLTALKARLGAVGVQAELIGEGVLVCRGGDVETAVAVRKSARGQVELEGTVCDVYYKVRKEIYGLHALVSS